MERYLEGQELSTEEVAKALEGGGDARGRLPGRLRCRFEEPRHDGGARPARRGRPVPGEEGCAHQCRRRRDRRVRLQDDRRSIRGAHQRLSCAERHAERRLDDRERPLARQGAARTADGAAGQGARPGLGVRRGRHRCRRQAEGDADRRRAAGRRAAGRTARHRLPGARDELRRHAEGEGRRRKDGSRIAPARRGGSDDPDASRSADGRAAADRALADPRRGCRRPPQEPLQRRGRAAPAARSLPGDDPQRSTRARPLQEADRRARSVRRLRDRPRAAGRPSGLRVRRQDRRRRDPQSFRPAVDKGIQEAMVHGELAGAPVQGLARRPGRRLVPHGRLLGDGVQDRRLDGVQVGVREGRPGACSSRSWSSR